MHLVHGGVLTGLFEYVINVMNAFFTATHIFLFKIFQASVHLDSPALWTAETTAQLRHEWHFGFLPLQIIPQISRKNYAAHKFTFCSGLSISSELSWGFRCVTKSAFRTILNISKKRAHCMLAIISVYYSRSSHAHDSQNWGKG